jgi:uncharacterized phage-associated protein
MAQHADEAKFAEMLLFFADGLKDAKLAGSTKLNKLLWFAECAHFRHYGRPISGIEFQKLRNGPAPRRLLPVRERLISEQRARLVHERTPLGKLQDRLVALAAPDLSRFTGQELETMTAVLDELRDATGTALSELSHDEPAWKLTEVGETIPIQACLLVDVEVPPMFAEHAVKVATSLGLR